MSQITTNITNAMLGDILTLTGNTGGAVGPTGGNVNIVGSGSVSVAGNAGTSTLTISSSGIVTIAGNTGTATGSTITFIGSASEGTPKFSASGSTVSLAFDDANFNLGIGTDALNTLAGTPTIGGVGNVVVGGDSGALISTGNENTMLGEGNGIILNTGSNNVMLGNSIGQSIISGSNNILIGNQTGRLYTGAESNNIIIAAGAWAGEIVGETNTLRIGEPSHSTITNAAYICGIQGVNVGSTASVVTIAGTNANQLGSAVLTAGTNIAITPGAGTITISATGADAFAWSVITANQTAAVFKGYFCNKAGTLALALPAASAVGDVIEVANINTATGTQFTQAAGQQIFFAGASTTSGATGTLTSSAVGDTLRMVCRVANLTWQVVSSLGNWSVV